MTQQQKHPFRELTPEERQYLEKISRSQSESASRVIRAKLLLAAAEGFNYMDAAHSVGRRSGDAVGKLVARFNAEGIANLLTLIPSIGLLLPSLAIANPILPAPTSPPSFVSLQVSPTPDVDGVYSFVAEAGEIVSVRREFSPDHPNPCYPELVGGEGITLLGEAIQLTPYSESVIFRINAAGRYEYRVQSSTASLRIGDLVSEPIQENAEEPSEEHWCRVTVQPAADYEQTWAIANRLYDQQEDPEQALELYRQVLAAQPGYPEPYKRYMGLLMELHMSYVPLDVTPEALGQQWLRLPDTVRQTLVENVRQLAQLYAANPTWQIEPTDRPDLLNDYATFIETGVASEAVRTLLFPSQP